MSATRDKNQKSVFVYSNLYQIYRKGKDAAKDAPDVPRQLEGAGAPSQAQGEAPTQGENPGLTQALTRLRQSLEQGSGHFVVHKSAPRVAPGARVQPYNPPELLGARLGARRKEPVAVGAIESLRANLKLLGDLHARLRFMLEELEELSRD